MRASTFLLAACRSACGVLALNPSSTVNPKVHHHSFSSATAMAARRWSQLCVRPKRRPSELADAVVHHGSQYDSQSQQDTSILFSDSSSISSHPPDPEYWLDLRGISVSPTEAIRFLSTLVDSETEKDSNECDTMTTPTFVNRVLMDESDFTDRVKASSSSSVDPGCSILLYSKDKNNNDQATISVQQSGLLQFTPFAIVLTAQPDRNLDAMRAMDMVLGQRQWIFVESDPAYQQESGDWMSKQVAALYDVLATSYGSASPELGSLILPSTHQNHGTLLGGVAVKVSTPSALADIDFAFMQSALARQMKSSTDSDLLLPTGAIRPTLQTALVIPFDVDIWRLLLDLKQT